MKTQSATHQRKVAGLARAVAALLLFSVTAGLLGACTAQGDDFGTPTPGQRVYDRTGLLTEVEVRDLERRAALVAQAGAPVVVYMRAHSGDYTATERAARDLMSAWGVESAPGAHDGVVIFLNAKPGDLRHGQVALYAGERHVKGGNLPTSELKRIYEQEMRPLLADEQTAAGIGAGLAALAQSLTFGPPPTPPPSALQRAAATIARLPLNLLALGLVGWLVAFARRHWRARTAPAPAGPATLVPPDTLAPALVGALVTRRLQGAPLAEATILDLARRGALALEPVGRKRAQLRLLDAGVATTAWEQRVWATLSDAAKGATVLPDKAFARLATRWGPFNDLLRAELVARGWYDPQAPGHRRALSWAGGLTLVPVALALAISIVGREGWGLLAVALLSAASVALLSLGAVYPETTASGEAAAAPWRGYQAGLRAAGRDPAQALDLDAVLPAAAALGVVSALAKRLKAASKEGYAPSWFVRTATVNDGFYPYWTAFHVGATASASGGTGAAAGGGGAGGSY